MVFLAATGLAVVAFWLSTRAGILALAATDPFAGLPRSTAFFCSASGVDYAGGEAGAGQVWGFLILLPLPFLLIGLIGFLLYRSSHKNRWPYTEARGPHLKDERGPHLKEGRDGWDY